MNKGQKSSHAGAEFCTVPFRSFVKLGLLIAVAVFAAGCSSSPTGGDKTPDQLEAQNQADLADLDAKMQSGSDAGLIRKYSGPAYDGERRKLCQHFKLNPHVAAVALDPNSSEDDHALDVLLRRGVSAQQTRALAFRIQGYMAAHYSGDRALIVREINIHHQASENAQIAALSRVTGGQLGMVGAIVQNGVEDTDTTLDRAWHIEINRKQVK